MAAKVTDVIPRTSAADFPSTEQRYVFYGLYKQALMGPQKEPQPAGDDIIAKWKWNAWNDQRSKSRQLAMQEYIVSIHTMLHGLDLTELPTSAKDLTQQFLSIPLHIVKAAAKWEAGSTTSIPPVSAAAKAATKTPFVSALDAVAGSAPAAMSVQGVEARRQPSGSSTIGGFAVPASKGTPARVSRSTGTIAYRLFRCVVSITTCVVCQLFALAGT